MAPAPLLMHEKRFSGRATGTVWGSWQRPCPQCSWHTLQLLSAGVTVIHGKVQTLRCDSPRLSVR